VKQQQQQQQQQLASAMHSNAEAAALAEKHVLQIESF